MNQNNSNCDNILEPLVNTIVECEKIFFKSVYFVIDKYLFKTNSNKIKFNKFFRECNIYELNENKEKIYPKHLNTIDTPKGLMYEIEIPKVFNDNSIKNIIDKTKTFLNSNINHKVKKGILYLEIIDKELPTVIDYELNPKEKDLILYLGNSLEGKVTINLTQEPNTYIVGTTGSGKSVCTKSILTSFICNYSPKEIELYLCDMKRVELNLFKNVEHCKKFAYTLESVTETIEYIFEECEKRYSLLMKHNLTHINQYNTIFKNKKLPYKILYVEEITLLLQDKKNVAMKKLKMISTICRACGIYLFITTQRPSSDILDSVVKASINNRIVFKCEDEKNSIIALDKEGANNLNGKGHGILKVGSDFTEFQGYYISDEKVNELIKPYIKKENIKVKTRQIGFVDNKKVIEPDEEIDLSFLDKL